jgi:hypothetical protein
MDNPEKHIGHQDIASVGTEFSKSCQKELSLLEKE